jgi:hydroxyacylglutathione hydrolase
MKIEKVSSNIWKIKADSNVYFIDNNEKIVIDTGRKKYRDLVLKSLGSLVSLDKITKVIFTHLHYDHIGNYDLFPKAEFFASAQEIKDFQENMIGAVLDNDMINEFKISLKPAADFDGLKIINAPGHTRGSICIWYEKEKILFSGDTIFSGNSVGRTDLPTSAPDGMKKTLSGLRRYKYKILCPGHDY